MNTTKIGWIGLGKMGIPMSKQLLTAGYPVTVYNRDKKKESVLTALGATTSVAPAAMMNEADVIILMVADDNATREIFTGAQGLLNGKANGKLIINMSTVSPAISREMAILCQSTNNTYLDAPVSGSLKQAEEAQLVIMVGGDESVFDRARPILDSLGKLTMLVGPVGAGNIAKLAVNTLLAFHAQGLAETVVFAKQHGIKTTDLVNLINNSALGNPLYKIKGAAIINNHFQPVFALKHIAKDLRLAKELGLDSPMANTVSKSFQQAEANLGEADIIAIIQTLQP